MMLFMKCTEKNVCQIVENATNVKKQSHTILQKVQVNSQILTNALLMQLQKEKILQEPGYLKGDFFKVSWCPFVE